MICLLTALVASAEAGEIETLSSGELRSVVTQTPGAVLVAAWTVEELREATQTVDVQGLSLESMDRSQGRAWLEARKDCVMLVQRLDTDSWQLETFGDCPRPAPSAPSTPRPSPSPAVNPEMVWRPNARPQLQLGFQAGLTGLYGLPVPSAGLHTGVQFGSPFSLGARGFAEVAALQVPDHSHELAQAGGELLLEWERPRNSFQLSAGALVFDDTSWSYGGGERSRTGQRWTAALGWQHPSTLRNDPSRRGHGLLLRTTLDPRGLQTLSLQWTYAWDWRL